jgi:hypothetical protein
MVRKSLLGLFGSILFSSLSFPSDFPSAYAIGRLQIEVYPNNTYKVCYNDCVESKINNQKPNWVLVKEGSFLNKLCIYNGTENCYIIEHNQLVGEEEYIRRLKTPKFWSLVAISLFLLFLFLSVFILPLLWNEFNSKLSKIGFTVFIVLLEIVFAYIVVANITVKATTREVLDPNCVAKNGYLTIEYKNEEGKVICKYIPLKNIKKN